MGKKHSKIKENITYGSTGLIEGVRVGQEELWPESFDSMDRTQATCNVHSCVGDVGPNSMQCFGVRVFLFQSCYIGHC